jgi:hypothetical protein
LNERIPHMWLFLWSAGTNLQKMRKGLVTALSKLLILAAFGKMFAFWKHLSDPPINEELLLAGREAETNSLLESLSQTSRCIHLKADSLYEAQAFVIVTAQALPPTLLLKMPATGI